MKKIFINLIRNFYSSHKYDFHKDILGLEQQIYFLKQQNEKISNQLISTQRKNIFNEARIYYLENPNKALKYQLELKNLSEYGLAVFPYKQLNTLNSINCDIDKNLEMPFIIHNGKKLFFPSSWTNKQSINTYKNLIEIENILDGDYKEKAPHQYQSKNFRIEGGDVLLDVGCAEGLLSLDSVDRVKKIYLFESDKKWIAPLMATFAPFSEKVEIINKIVSEVNSEKEITLNTILKKDNSDSFFIKMDIEGYETQVVKNSLEFLKSTKKKIKLACCTYHKPNDADKLKFLFESINYKVKFSDGYMFFYFDNNLQVPYFRKGIIRANNYI